MELKGSGRSHLLRIYIDRPEGVTHADCELVSREVSAVLDVEDPIPGTYELEVSSPGVERKLGKWQDWRRFAGKKVKVVLKERSERDARFGGSPDAEALRRRDLARAEDHSRHSRTGGRQARSPFQSNRSTAPT